MGRDDEVSLASGPRRVEQKPYCRASRPGAQHARLCVRVHALSLPGRPSGGPLFALQGPTEGHVLWETSPPLPAPALLGFQLHVSVAQRRSGLSTRCFMAACPDFCSSMDQNVPLLSNNLAVSPAGNLHSGNTSHIWQILRLLEQGSRSARVLSDCYRLNCVPLKKSRIEALTPRTSEWASVGIYGPLKRGLRQNEVTGDRS